MECVNCGSEIPDTKRSHAKYCSDLCGNQYRNKRYYWNHPEEMKEKRARDNAMAPQRILSRVKNRAKKLDIPFNLTVEDIVIPENCPVLGIPIYPNQCPNPSNSPSVDRIVPELGYVKGNVRVISNRANLLKSNATIEELEKVLEDLRCVTS